MVIFSCKKISQKDLITCAFNLNKTQYDVLIFLMKKQKEYTAQKIAEMMKLDRTTVQKAIKELLKKQLVQRAQINLQKGGYTFIYNVNDKTKIKRKIKKLTYDWYKTVEAAIDEL
jgi:predicted transcriptional regulator